jgi:hypothetical protein
MTISDGYSIRLSASRGTILLAYTGRIGKRISKRPTLLLTAHLVHGRTRWWSLSIAIQSAAPIGSCGTSRVDVIQSFCVCRMNLELSVLFLPGHTRMSPEHPLSILSAWKGTMLL